MAPQNSVPFFAELGLLLNLVRSISSAMNKVPDENLTAEDAFSNVRYLRSNSLSSLIKRMQALETDIAYFFTDNGIRKATDSMFDAQFVSEKFSSTFKALSNEYFTIKSGLRNKIAFHQNTGVKIDAGIYKLVKQRPAIVN